MISNQPRNKLHSQLDHGAVSQADRPKGVEPMTMHPRDAAVRGLIEGQIVKIHNTRGACLAELRISDMTRPGVIQIATGAWLYSDGDLCRNGNPNVLTRDKGTSRLAQGPVAHSCLVKVETIAGKDHRLKR
jgi:biotin/methionine sulfoxide reductase